MDSSLQDVLTDITRGQPVIIVDSDDREAEGDLMIAADQATYANLSFMALHGRGIMCLPCTSEYLDRLNIPMMASNKLDKFSTPFANSIDASYGITTGVSIEDRLKTIEIFLDKRSIPQELAQPGHLFPLRARAGLLEERQGHTEAGVALSSLAGRSPVAVIIEIMNVDGTMMRGSDLRNFAAMYGLHIISIDAIRGQIK